jgi:Protein RETICULATA-related
MSASWFAGTSISNGLIKVRQMADPNFVQQNDSPPVVLNSLAWTLHMGVSSNIRYQMLNGLDMVPPTPCSHTLVTHNSCILYHNVITLLRVHLFVAVYPAL